MTYVHDTWENNLKRLENNEIDLMVDVAVSEERKKIYDFNDETGLVAWGLFYTRNGIKLDSVTDLDGKKIAVMRSGILYSGPLGLKDMLSSFGIKADIVNVDVYEDVFKLLDSGQADAGVVNYFFGITNESQYSVNRTGILFQPAELRYALTKDASQNGYFINAIDSNLKEIKDNPDSVYHKSIKTNFGKFVEKMEVFPGWAKYLLAIVSVLVGILVLISLSMKQYQGMLEQRVKKKTSELEFKNKILTMQQEVSLDGILVMDENRKILFHNKQAVEIWNIPEKIMESGDDKVVQFIADTMAYPEEFMTKVEYLYANKDKPSHDEMLLKDGRTIECYSASALSEEDIFYRRVWYFRDITERRKREEEFQIKYGEMERMHKMMIGRELRMTELKRENDELKAKLENIIKK